MMMASTSRIWLSPAGLFCIEAGRLVIVHVPSTFLSIDRGFARCALFWQERLFKITDLTLRNRERR